MSRRVEIGSLREVVEIVDPPSGAHIGRMRRANGENVAIDERTLSQLMGRAGSARGETAVDIVFDARGVARLLA